MVPQCQLDAALVLQDDLIGSLYARVDDKEMEVLSFLQAAASFKPKDVPVQSYLTADAPEPVEGGGVNPCPIQGRDDVDFSGSG